MMEPRIAVLLRIGDPHDRIDEGKELVHLQTVVHFDAVVVRKIYHARSRPLVDVRGTDVEGVQELVEGMTV